MIIGSFKYSAEDDCYSGEIRTISMTRANIMLRPTRKANEREPDYRVVEEMAGKVIELGAAWRRRTEKGQTFLSVTLDDPTFPQALSAALFDDRDGTASLVWTRPRSKTPDAAPQQETAKTTPRRPAAARAPRPG